MSIPTQARCSAWFIVLRSGLQQVIIIIIIIIIIISSILAWALESSKV